MQPIRMSYCTPASLTKDRGLKRKMKFSTPPSSSSETTGTRVQRPNVRMETREITALLFLPKVTMASLITSLPLIFVIMTAGVGSQQDWGVDYSPSYICALKKSTVKISCTLKNPHDHELKTVFWTKTGSLPHLCLVPNNRGRVQCVREYKDTYSITLRSVTEADEHMYYCRFTTNTTNTEGGKWTELSGAQLDVTELQVETQRSVKEGDSVNLTCKTSCSLTEQTTFIWYKGKQIVTKGIVKENQLHLRSVSRKDEGYYQCVVKGNEFLKSPNYYLRVEYPPQNVSVSISPSGEIEEGDSVTLICNSNANPPAEISWFKGETFLKNGDTYSITNITSEASGNYYCSAKNNQGSQDSAAVTVNVMYPLKSVSVSISPSAEIVEGDSVTLICSSDSNTPALNFSWFKENQTSAVGSGQSFSISSVNSSHSGLYYCEAQNKHGSERSASVSVTVKGVQRAVLHTVTGIVAGCGGLIFIIIIIIIFISWKRRREGGTEDVNQKQTADSSDDTYTALDPVSRTSADIYSTIRSGDSRAPDDTYTALQLQSRSSEYETLAGTSADPH